MSDYVRLPEPWRKAYCFVVQGGCEIRKAIRDKVIFHQENLLQPQVTEACYDFIFCRNVLIYFDKDSSRNDLHPKCWTVLSSYTGMSSVFYRTHSFKF